MPRLRQVFSWCLLLLWLPATQHCRLEAAGADFAMCDHGCHAPAPTPSDNCDVVENSLYKDSVRAAKALRPLLITCACLACVPPAPAIIEPGPVPDDAAVGRSRDWVIGWQFLRRAAPPARAPAPLNA